MFIAFLLSHTVDQFKFSYTYMWNISLVSPLPTLEFSAITVVLNNTQAVDTSYTTIFISPQNIVKMMWFESTQFKVVFSDREFLIFFCPGYRCFMHIYYTLLLVYLPEY